MEDTQQMEGNVVTAAKWLGASMVLASAILVGGLRWVLSSVEGERPSGAPNIEASQSVQAAPLPGDLEELAKSFRGPSPRPEANARPGSADQPRSLFADQPLGPGPTQSHTSP